MLKVQTISTEEIPQASDIALKVLAEDGQQITYCLPRALAIHLTNQLMASLDVQGQYVIREEKMH